MGRKSLAPATVGCINRLSPGHPLELLLWRIDLDLDTLQPGPPRKLCSLNLRCFPADLREQLRQEARARRYSLQQYAVKLLAGELRRPKNTEVK